MKISDYVGSTVILDAAQSKLISEFEDIKTNIFKPIFLNLRRKKQYKGIYIYGTVGTGKTILLQAFFDSLDQKKIFYHYQAFIKYLHEELHLLFLGNQRDPVLIMAKNLASLYKVICIDELEIRDITDAMLIQNLCIALSKLRVIIMFTSNTQPNDLYRDGIQRESFMKFIDFIEKNFFIRPLITNKDYRFSKIAANKNLILFPNSEVNLRLFNEMVDALIRNIASKKDKVVVFGRDVEFKKCYNNEILYTNYEELFLSELSYNDYLEVCKKYKAIILEKIDHIMESSDVIIRFINFIDNAYVNKITLVAYFAERPENLASTTKYNKEFKRTISRISEMNSTEYICNTKYYKK